METNYPHLRRNHLIDMVAPVAIAIASFAALYVLNAWHKIVPVLAAL